MKGMEFGEIFTAIVNRHYEQHNSTNVSLDSVIRWQPLQEHPVISVIYLVCICTTVVIGLIGNTLVIGAVCVHRKLRTTGNLFIVNLAIADLVVVAIVQPYTIIGVVIGPEHFVYRETICHVVSTVCVMACANSMMTLAGIAVNRYIFVCRNRYYHRIYNRCTTPLICFGLWVIVFLVDLPNYTGWGAHSYDYKSLGCSFDRLHSFTYVLFLSISIYWIPLFLLSICYVLIYRYVQKNRKQLRAAFSRSSCTNKSLLDTRKEEDIRMIRTFFIVVVVFLVCWTPYDLLALVDRKDEGPMLLYIILISIGHANSSINSILYATTNRRFRRGYLQFLSMVLCRYKKMEKVNYFNTTKRVQNNIQNSYSNSQSSLNTAMSNKSKVTILNHV